MVRYQPLAAGMAASLILGAPILASTIPVPANQPTLQQGINAAADGDTVLVAPGTYSGPNNQNLDFLGKDLILRSESGAPVTTIDPSAGRSFNRHSRETADAAIDGCSNHWKVLFFFERNDPFQNMNLIHARAVAWQCPGTTLRRCRC